MQVWCPMCEYLGLGAFKAELEEWLEDKNDPLLEQFREMDAK